MHRARILRTLSIIGIGTVAMPFASCQLDQASLDSFLASLGNFAGNVQIKLKVESEGDSGVGEDHAEGHAHD